MEKNNKTRFFCFILLDYRAFSKTEISAGSAVAQPSSPLDALHSSTRLRDASCWKENDHKNVKQ